MKKSFFKIFSSIMAGLVLIQSMGVFANSAAIDTSFNTGVPVGVDDHVEYSAIQSDGKIIIGGQFATYQGVAANKIIRLNRDGSRDPSFNIGTGFDNIVVSIAVQSDGKIILGGLFTTYQGVAANRIIRLNADGSRDSSFNIGNGFNSSVLGIEIQSDGKIIVGGDFTTYQGVAANKIIRLNADGSRDSSFDAGDGFNYSSSTIVIQSDGKILVGGFFTTYQGVAANRIIRLNADGSRDSSFDAGDGFDNKVNEIVIQSDGKIIIGGRFTTYQGVGARRIIRLNANGSRDSSFAMGDGFNNDISAIAMQSDGKIIVGGQFFSYQGVAANQIIRLNADGSRDSSFDIGNGFNTRVRTIAIESDGKIIVGGNFSTYQGVTRKYIIRLNTDGSRDSFFNTGNGFDDRVNKIAIQSDGKIIIGGEFTIYQGVTANRIIRLNADGSKDTSFDIGNGFNSSVNTIAIQDDGKIIIGGDYGSYQGVAANRIIRLNADGSRDSSFNIGNGFSASVNTIAIQDDGKIIIGGRFFSYQGVAANKIIRLNADGSRDSSFAMGNGFNNDISAIAMQSDGKIIVGGNFTTYQGVAASRIIRLNADGSKDTSFDIGNGFNDRVLTTAIQSDGKIIIGGHFTTYQGVGANRIIRLNADGSRDSSFDIGNGFNNRVNTIAIQSDGKILIGGGFSDYQGVAANRIIRLNADGSRDSSFAMGNGFNSTPSNIAIQSDGEIVVGGSFVNYNNNPAGYLTKLYGDTDVVNVPNSTDNGAVNDAFLDKGYSLEAGGDLIGDVPMSLSMTDGTIPVDLSIRNGDITMSLEADSQILGSDSTNYDGIFAVPVPRDIESVNNSAVLSAFKVGAISESLTIDNSMTLSVAVPTEDIGQYIQVYNAEDNGVSRYPETTTQVIDKDGVPTVEFTTNSFGDFALTEAPETTPPTASVIYSTTGATNQDVVATLTGESETLTGLNMSAYTFTGNGEFIFTFQDLAGNTGAVTATVDWIDKTSPIGSIDYSTTGRTTYPVNVTLSLNETGSITNNSGSNTYTFTTNGSFTFDYQDLAGNTGSATANVDWIEGNGGGIILIKDKCSDGDYSPSYYDGLCESPVTTTGTLTQTISTEMQEAYEWAFSNGITTKPTIEEAAMDKEISRAEIAKMISQYATQIKGQIPNTGTSCVFTDIADVTPDLIPYIEQSCQLGIMGKNSNGNIDTSFNPYGLVNRGEFATILSRVMWGTTYDGGEPFYARHIEALYNNNIITNTDPLLIEMRGYVMLMMMRAEGLVNN